MSDDETRSIPHDVAFDLLSSPRRRFVLRRLQQTPEGIDIGDLSTQLAAREADVPQRELTRADRKRIYVSLYQTHVPKLQDHGVVTYDTETGVVRPTERVDELATYFESGTRFDDWEPLYLLIAVVGLSAFGAADAVGLSIVEPIHVGVAVLLVIAVLSLAQYALTDGLGRAAATIPVEE